MKVYWCIVILICIINTRCSDNYSQFPTLILGDWSSGYIVDSANKQKQDMLFFSFYADSCQIGDGLNSEYVIKDDTLIINAKRKKYQGSKKWNYEYVPYTFVIKNLDTNTLLLSYKHIKGYNPFNREVIKLNRIHTKNNMVFEKIGFYHSSWHDNYSNETQYLELKASGEVLLEVPRPSPIIPYASAIKQDIGVLDTNQNLFAGIISDIKLDRINELIQYLPIDSLAEYYSVQATHQNSFRITITSNGNTYESGSYGYSIEPVGLRMLYRELMRLYVVSNLRPDTIGMNKFELIDFYNRRYKNYRRMPPENMK